MNRIIFSLFILLGLFSCSSSNNIIDGGKSNYKIFVSNNASRTEQYAAAELQQYLFKISGYQLPIVSRSDVQEELIYVGFQEAPESLLSGVDPQDFGSEEYIIRSANNQLLIAGGEPRGTLYGVIGYLSDHLDCRWYTKEVEKIPQTKTISLPAINDRQKPAFEYREAWYHEAYQTDWAIHNRLNPSLVPIPDSLGGSYIAYPFVHTFYSMVPPGQYFKQHPEYFSEVNGKRVGKDAQLCLTNPEVVKIATESVLGWIKDHPEASVFSVDQNDGLGYCECRKCKALDDAEGSHSGTLLHFVNQVAESVAKVYPDVKLQTLAYAYTEIPPKTLRPAPNVTIRLCHYNYCSAHPIGVCSSHQVFVDRLNQWKTISSGISIWDYFTDYSRYLMPFPNFEPVKHDLKFYKDHGVTGIFAQGSNMPSQGGSEFSTLRAWVFSQLMWNPERDGEALVNEFVEAVYGPSAQPVKDYIRLLHDQVKPDSVYFSIYAEPGEVNYLTPETIRAADSLFQLAFQKAGNDISLNKRLELAYLPVLYTKVYFYGAGAFDFMNGKSREEVVDQFKRIISENKITRIAEQADNGNIEKLLATAEGNQTFYTDWWIVGPFDNETKRGLITTYEPEKKFDTSAIMEGKGGAPIQWRRYDNPNAGFIDFAHLFDPSENVVAYARRTVMMPEAKKVRFGIGSNDGVRVWVNGKLVLDRQVGRRARVNDDIITVALQKGDNDILVKVDQLKRGWGFYFTELE